MIVFFFTLFSFLTSTSVCSLLIHDIRYPLARTFAANHRILFRLTSYKVTVPVVRTEGHPPVFRNAPAPGIPVSAHIFFFFFSLCHLLTRTTQYKNLAMRDAELELQPAVLGAAETCQNLHHAAGLSVGTWGKSLSPFEKPPIAL